MIFRAFRRTDTRQWVDVLFAANADADTAAAVLGVMALAGSATTPLLYPADAAEQAKDLAAALKIAPSLLEAVDGASDPRTGTLISLPTPVPSPDDDAETHVRSLRTKALAVFAGTDTFTAPQVQKILAGLVLRSTR